MPRNSLRLFGNYFLLVGYATVFKTFRVPADVSAGYEHQHLLMQTRGSVFHGTILGIADENIHRNQDYRVYAVIPLMDNV